MADQTIPEGSVVITPGEVYARVLNLTDQVTQLLAQKDRTEEQHQRLEVRVEGLEGRVARAEAKLWIITGAAATLGGSIGAGLGKLFGAH